MEFIFIQPGTNFQDGEEGEDLFQSGASSEISELREPSGVAVSDRHFPDGEEGEDPTGEAHDRAGREEEARPGRKESRGDLHRGPENAHLGKKRKERRRKSLLHRAAKGSVLFF